MKVFLTLLLSLTFSISFSQTAKEHIKQGEDYYNKDDFKNAVKYANLALKADPNNESAMFLKANSLEQLKDYQAAFNAYTEMIKYYPNNPLVYNQRGLLLKKVQEFDLAITDFDRGIALGADSMRLSLHLNRGATKINKRDFQGAYNDFMVCYSIDSLDIGTLNNLASVSDEIGKGEQTLVYLHKILKIDSTFVGAWGNIGFKYQEMGDHKTAIQYFDKVLSMEPDEPLAYNNRAFNKYKMKDLKGALSDVNKSIQLYPGNSFAFKNRALIYIEQKKKKDACADIQEALRLGFTQMYGEEVEKLQAENCK